MHDAHRAKLVTLFAQQFHSLLGRSIQYHDLLSAQHRAPFATVRTDALGNPSYPVTAARLYGLKAAAAERYRFLCALGAADVVRSILAYHTQQGAAKGQHEGMACHDEATE